MQKYCEFFSLSEDKESVKYILPEGMTVFSILNIPPKYNKEEVKNDIELINLQYNRLYKNGFYWILSTTDKETIICVQNSLRELIFDEVRIKFIHHNKNQILKNMKDKLDKNSYQKDTKYLGINNGYGKNKYKKGQGFDDGNDAFSWRKGSNKSSFDYSEKYYKKGGYYKYKRNRFNSGDDWKKNKNYQYQNYYNKNNQEIEIDISNLKYDLNIKNKYTFGEIKNYLQKYNEQLNGQKPQFQNEDLIDIISKSKKEIVALDELIECNEKNKAKDSSNKKQNKTDKNDNNFNNTNNNVNNNSNVIPNIKIPKMNPLSGMSKAYNKFDIIPGNAMTGYMMPFPAPFSIEESNKEE